MELTKGMNMTNRYEALELNIGIANAEMLIEQAAQRAFGLHGTTPTNVAVECSQTMGYTLEDAFDLPIRGAGSKVKVMVADPIATRAMLVAERREASTKVKSMISRFLTLMGESEASYGREFTSNFKSKHSIYRTVELTNEGTQAVGGIHRLLTARNEVASLAKTLLEEGGSLASDTNFSREVVLNFSIGRNSIARLTHAFLLEDGKAKTEYRLNTERGYSDGNATKLLRSISASTITGDSIDEIVETATGVYLAQLESLLNILGTAINVEIENFKALTGTQISVVPASLAEVA
jgi:hypothetical protein